MKIKKANTLILALIMCFSFFFTSCDKIKLSKDKSTMGSGSDSSSSVFDGTVLINANSSDSSSKVSFEFKSTNSWKEGENTIYEYKGIVKNNQSTVLSDWTIKIPISKEAKIKQSWSVKFEIKDGFIILTPDTYNKEIPSGGSFDFGLQIQLSGELAYDKATFSATSKSSADTSSNTNSTNNTANEQAGGEKIANTGAKPVPEATSDDWLSVKGNKIVDASGKEVWLTGVNWFGYNTGTNCFDGLWAADLNSSLASIADHGFNLLRVPISIELVNQWQDGKNPVANFNNSTNSYLVGKTSLQIFDYAIGQCRANGIKIMIDFHCAKTDSMGHMKPLWTDGNITEKDYLRALEWIADRYKNDDTIIAVDLKNEPHGKPTESPRAKWDNSTDADNWKYMAEKAGNAVLSKNPNVLIMVEGIEIYPKDINTNGNFKSTSDKDYYYDWWGGNLRGVKDYPINLGSHQDKLVYSPHDYGPTVYEQPWLKGNYTFDSVYKDCWKDNWMYIYENKTAPLLIGEWGGFMKEPNLKWMTYMRKLIKDNKLNHTFWCFNANSGDTGGLVLGDFVTWDTEKYAFVKEVLWQKDGKFVGLDHKIPLGKNGITLTDY